MASYQSGILNRPPEHNLVAALRFSAAVADPASAVSTVLSLREIVRREVGRDLDHQDAASNLDAPSPETGELGFVDGYNNNRLTITVGFGASTFDRLGVTDRPADLYPIDWTKLQEAPTLSSENGDLAIQACSDDIYVCEHVLRRIEEEIGDRLEVVWVQLGSQRYTSQPGPPSRGEGRAMIGFLDGTANLNPRHESADRRLVFVEPNDVLTYPKLPAGQPLGYPGTDAFPPDLRTPPAAEPEWTRGGTYMVVRASTQNIGAWDDQTLGEQQRIVGRHKYSGASLDQPDDPARREDPPAFVANQALETVPVDSHVRKTNPQRPEDIDRRIFRRGYPIISPRSGGLARGLLFVCFARTISTQFEFIWRAWVKNENFPRQGAGRDRILAFDEPLCGGYYFVPPIRNANKPWSWILPVEGLDT